MKKFFFLLIYIVVVLHVRAQLSTCELPYSFKESEGSFVLKNCSIDSVVISSADERKVIENNQKPNNFALPFQYGALKQTEITLENSGTWLNNDDGSRIWKLRIKSPGAKTINLIYDKFWIPRGGKFFIYSPDKQQHIGAFTFKNNKSDREHVAGFATGLIAGDEIILEYYQPLEVDSNAVISISHVVCGFMDLSYLFPGLGTSCSNQVNVNCAEGQNWQNEKKAIACILHENYVCTGALINTTLNDCQPLLLTANHCLNGKDAITSPDLDNWIFYWNYEYSDCNSTSLVSNIPATVGATVYANNSNSDFALLYLTEDPKEINNYTPYYLGWDISDNNLSGVVCIHHPKGDAKKIATKTMYPSSALSGNAWYVTFSETTNGFGIPEEGSSGAPLFNNQHKVIGHLNSGNPNCSNPEDSEYYFGKFSVSWTGPTSDSRRRLYEWLNPNHMNVTAIDGKYPDVSVTGPRIVGNAIICDSAVYYVEGLTSNQSVVWTKINMSYHCSLLINHPLQNQCMVKKTGSPASCTLVATIYEGSTQIAQLTKDVHIKLPFNGYFSQEACAYHGTTHPAIANKTIILGNSHFVHQGCRVQVVSEAFRYMTISYNGYPPSEFSYNGGNTVTFSMPYGSGGAPFIIQARGEGGCFDFDILFFSISGNGNIPGNSLSIKPNTLGYEISVIHCDERNVDASTISCASNLANIPWTLEIYNLQNGNKVFSTEVKELTYFLNTSGWDSGNYAVRAVFDGKTLTNKIRVK